MSWFVYVLASAPSRVRGPQYYVGITNDLDRRVEQHNGERPGGARRTAVGRPWTLARRLGPFESRGEALRIEHALKKRRGEERLSWEPSASDAV